MRATQTAMEGEVSCSCQAAMAAVQENHNQPFLHVEREVRKAVKARALEKIKLFGSDGKAE